MDVTVRGNSSLRPTRSMVRYAERRLGFAMRPYPQSVRAVQVLVDDVNGPKGGLDKRCRVIVSLVPAGTVVIEDESSSVYSAVSHCASRVGPAVARKLSRRGQSRKIRNRMRRWKRRGDVRVEE